VQAAAVAGDWWPVIGVGIGFVFHFLIEDAYSIRGRDCWLCAAFGGSRHTYPVALRGGRALGLIAVRIRPPNGLSRIFQGIIGIALWRYI